MTVIIYSILAVLVSAIASFFIGRQKGVKSANLQNEVNKQIEVIQNINTQGKIKDDVIEEINKTVSEINRSPDGSIADKLRREYSRDGTSAETDKR